MTILRRVEDMKIGQVFLDSGHKWRVISIVYGISPDEIFKVSVGTVCSCRTHGYMQVLVDPLIFIDKEMIEEARILKII